MEKILIKEKVAQPFTAKELIRMQIKFVNRHIEDLLDDSRKLASDGEAEAIFHMWQQAKGWVQLFALSLTISLEMKGDVKTSNSINNAIGEYVDTMDEKFSEMIALAISVSSKRKPIED